MDAVDLDFETRSQADIRTTGAWRYSVDPSTKVLCVVYSVNGGPRELWLPGMPTPDAMTRPYLMIGHNCAFERCISTNVLEKRFKWAKPAQYECTMVAAYQRNLPGALVDTAPALGLEVSKSKEGRAVMLRMCKHDYEDKVHARWMKKSERKSKPLSSTVAWFSAWAEIDNDLRSLVAYCHKDVEVESEIHKILPMHDPDLYDLDVKINSRGMWVDVKTCGHVLRCIDAEVEDMHKELQDITEGEVQTGKQVAKLTVWLRSQGYTGTDLSAESVRDTLENPNPELTERGLAVLRLRQRLGLGSIGKYKTMLKRVDSDCRIRDLVQLRGGAQTGRYAGRGIQPQNLPRLELKDKEIMLAIDLFRKEDRSMLQTLFGDVSWVAKQLIRPMLGSPGGLIVSDFAQIEARVLAWISGEKKMLDAFMDPSREPYIEMAMKIYRLPFDQITEYQRFIGKMCVLGAGYGLGGTTFMNQVNSRGGDILEEEALLAVKTYRREFKKVETFWYDTYRQFVKVIQNPNSIADVGDRMSVQSFQKLGTERVDVALTLPSNRKLSFHDCVLQEGDYSDPDMTFTNAKNERTYTYGGKLTENICQAIANDLLNHCMLLLDKQGFEIVLHVHDEVVVQNVKPSDVAPITAAMESIPYWAAGMPLKAETKFCGIHRYTK